MNILDQIKLKSSWGRKEVKTIPTYGEVLANEMKAIDKTNIGTDDLCFILFTILAKQEGFIYFNEFKDMMKNQKTMINKETAQQLLKDFWFNTNEYYKPNPKLFKAIKNVIISLNTNLISNNSCKQINKQFVDLFIKEILEANV